MHNWECKCCRFRSVHETTAIDGVFVISYKLWNHSNSQSVKRIGFSSNIPSRSARFCRWKELIVFTRVEAFATFLPSQSDILLEEFRETQRELFDGLGICSIWYGCGGSSNMTLKLGYHHELDLVTFPIQAPTTNQSDWMYITDKVQPIWMVITLLEQ